MNDPLPVPWNSPIGCSWQFPGVGQSRSTATQSSAAAESAPSSASDAEPENAIVSPAFHWVLAAGEAIAATGPLVTVIVAVSVSDAPDVSVTRNVTVYVPRAV